MQNQRSVLRSGRKPWSPVVMLLLLASAAAAWCEGPVANSAPALPSLTADQIVQRLTEKNRERAAGLQGYSGKRSYRLEYRGFPAATDATMVVDVRFDAPGPKRFTVISFTGSKLIESRVFARLLESEQQAGDASNRSRTELGANNYNFSLAGTDATNYVLNVEPRVESKFLYRGKIWVDAHDFAVTRIEAQPARNPSFWTTKSVIHHTYQKVGDFYLPRENQTVTSVRLGGTATLTIEYQSYQVTATPANAAKQAGSGEGAIWPDAGFNVALANLATARK